MTNDRDALLEALHRVRSVLARLKAELELAQDDRVAPGERALTAIRDAFSALSTAEDIAYGRAHAEPDASTPRGAQVFVVDDDLRLAQLSARQLSRLGHSSFARTELHEVAAELQPEDIVVIDLGVLEDADEEAVHTLQTCCFVVLSGRASREAEERARALGAAAFFVKPVDASLLAGKVKELKGGRP